MNRKHIQWRGIGVVGMVLSLSCVAAAPPPAWDRHVEATGGAALKHLKTLVIQARVTGALEGTLTYGMTPTQSWWELKTAVGRRRGYAEGDRTWTVDENGFTRGLDVAEQGGTSCTYDALINWCWFLAHPGGMNGRSRAMTVTAAGGEPDGEFPTHQLELSLAGGDLTYLTLDPTTSLLTQAHIPYVSFYGETWKAAYKDYRKIESLMVPFSTTISSSDGIYTLEVVSLAVNPTLPPDAMAQVELPRSSMQVQGPASSPWEIPFQVVGQGVFVKGAVGDIPSRFLVDSGSGATTLEYALVKRLGLTRAQVAQASGVGGDPTPQYLVKAPILQVGDVRFEEFVATSAPMMRAGNILGYSFFAPHAVELDFRASRIRIYREEYKPLPSALALDLQLAKNLPVITVEIPGVGPAHFLIDSAFGGTWGLFRSFVKRHGLKEKQSGSTGSGVTGVEQLGMVQLTEIRLGSTVIPSVQALVIGGFGAYPDGLLGLGYLRSQAGVVFDYPHKKVYFLPKPRLGVGWAAGAKGALTVGQVMEPSAAQRAGLQVGDKILAFGGQAVASQTEVVERLNHQQAGDVIQLTVQRPKNQELKLSLTLGSSLE